MRGYVYELRVVPSAIDDLHGNHLLIRETWVPGIGVAVNLIGSRQAHHPSVFRPNDATDRYGSDRATMVREVEVPDELARRLQAFVDGRDSLMKAVEASFSDLMADAPRSSAEQASVRAQPGAKVQE